MTMQWGGLVFGWLRQSAMWLIQWRRRDAGTVDVGWTAGVGLLGIFYALQAGGWAPRRYLAAALIGIWALRLAVYIVKDRIWGHSEEDGRYQQTTSAFFPWFPRQEESPACKGLQ